MLRISITSAILSRMSISSVMHENVRAVFFPETPYLRSSGSVCMLCRPTAISFRSQNYLIVLSLILCLIINHYLPATTAAQRTEVTTN